MPALNFPPSDPRYLVKIHDSEIRHGKTIASADDDALAPDEQRFYSFYTPALTAGLRTISVSQVVKAPGGSNFTLEGSQDFKITAPRFHIPPADLHSVYPPSGGTFPVKMLPYVVLKDPHLPWERSMGASAPTDQDRVRVPWLALWVFQPGELLLPKIDLLAKSALSETGTVRLKCKDFLNAGAAGLVPTPLKSNPNNPEEEDTEADFIFADIKVFQAFTQTYASDGSSSSPIDMSPYGYLAHVRKVGSSALKAAAASLEDDSFSVVLANRTGPLTAQQPLGKAVVHLVSLEGLDSAFTPAQSSTFVGLCSLYSWTFRYTSQDDQVEFEDALRIIGTPSTGVEFLRPPKEKWMDLVNSSDPIKSRVGKRLRDGYSLTKYRTLSGDETLAVQRGPLIPTTPPINGPLNRNIHLFSSQLQILDSQVGLVDNSYASAWNLGKTQALADEKFLNALVRLRTRIYLRALLQAKSTVMNQEGPKKILDRLISSVDSVLNLSDARKFAKEKWFNEVPPERTECLSLWDSALRTQFKQVASQEASILGNAISGGLYDEANGPVSTDWAVVLAWTLDALYLSNISWQHLLMEPSSLPDNSIRFFYVDPTWLNAYLDGALSVGNHVEGDQDSVRAALKITLQTFLNTVNPALGYIPQIPISGCLIRSSIVSHFPDLSIIADRPAGDTQAPILKRTNLAPDILLVLFDRPLTSVDFPDGIRICQPPHQQAFVASNGKISVDSIDMVYKRISTDPDSSSNVMMERLATVPEPAKPLLHSDYGIVHAKNIAQKAFGYLKDTLKTSFSELAPSATVLALHFSYTLTRLTLPLSAPDPEHPVNGFQLTMLEVQDLHGMGTGYNQREQAVKTSVFSSDENTLPQAQTDTESETVSYPTPRPPYFAPLSKLLLTGPRTYISASTETPTANMPTDTQYVLQVYALGYKSFSDPAGAETRIPRDVDGPLNLVFGLQRKSRPDGASYLLQAVSVHIPSDLSGSSAGLILGYTGPGASMANNIRFMPQIQCPPAAAGTASEVIINLSPRSRTPAENLLKSCETLMNKDLTYVLRQVPINKAASTLNVVFDIIVKEYYGDSQTALTSTARVKLVNIADL
ncbi:hypothetical protein TWF481_007010 [Arthrobotrys musiformis]|uniref:Hypercellular protein HypA n=1 Tax=Arthrobotrys musiformis TaxID=47236 RepID=A0AAV9WA62_9PEZI